MDMQCLYEVDMLDAGGLCDASCDTNGVLHCWGSGPDMCQTCKTLFACNCNHVFHVIVLEQHDIGPCIT